MRYTCYSDGGYDNKTKKGDGYGSYAIINQDGIEEIQRLSYEKELVSTSNEAEFETLYRLLCALEKKDSVEDSIIWMDSKLVVEVVNGNWKARQPNIKKFRDKILPLKEKFPQVELKWVSRKKIVKELGH